MASLGGLSGGLAHEINNPLTILSGRITSLNRMLIKDDYDRDKMLHACSSAMQSVKRIDSIVNALRGFSRNEYVEDLKKVDATSIIRESISSLSDEVQSIIEFIDEDESAWIMGNSILLQRVFSNLLGNSYQAIREMDSPWIRVEKVSSDPLIFSFKDSGPGISPEIAEHMMEPFFTTKVVGQGSGLGLSLCQNIMSLHGGSLKLNQESKHTEFLVTFSY
jgi:C4-dicarboxylate-specific signal transduction histidine kinase